MKVSYTTGNGRLTVELEGETQRDLFDRIGKFQEVFEESACGKCGSENLKFITRDVDGNVYYELRCSDCFAKLAFGCHKVGGGLFPKRKDADNNRLNDNGWVRWNRETNKEE